MIEDVRPTIFDIEDENEYKAAEYEMRYKSELKSNIILNIDILRLIALLLENDISLPHEIRNRYIPIIFDDDLNCNLF